MRLGWEPTEGESDLTAELRGLLIRTLAILGADRDAQHRARAIYQRDTAGEPVDPALASAALAVVAATASDADWDAIKHRFETADTPQDQIRHLYALGDVPEADQLRRTLELAMSSEVRSQNAPYLIGRCLRSREHGTLAWAFVRDHWDEMNERFPVPSIIRMLEGIKSLSTPEAAAETRPPSSPSTTCPRRRAPWPSSSSVSR